MQISEINIYPIKSLKGISVDEALVTAHGLQYDRRWVLTSADGQFLTQREIPKMATVLVEIRPNGLLVAADGITAMVVPFDVSGELTSFEVWGSSSDAIAYGGGVDQWFSQVLGTQVKLFYMPETAGREISERFNQGGEVVSFADGYPQLVIGEASLADLNGQPGMVAAPVAMKRFRPNIVVHGSEAYAEDRWKRISVGGAEFRGTKPCARCVMTTVDPERGQFDGKEPLRTFATFRMAKDVIPDLYESFGMSPTAVLFGQNLVGESIGSTIKVGDTVDVAETF
ncbi:MAG TPA: MOSC domain-containing protein [Pyrinomonadaceae bacterium]|nr:MOSC domain-containing protein [Pyrinomonadaceae bacterium]